LTVRIQGCNRLKVNLVTLLFRGFQRAVVLDAIEWFSIQNSI